MAEDPNVIRDELSELETLTRRSLLRQLRDEKTLPSASLIAQALKLLDLAQVAQQTNQRLRQADLQKKTADDRGLPVFEDEP